MHRPRAGDKRPARPSIARRLSAIAALVLTPVVGYALGQFAWEQAQSVMASAPTGSVFGASALTLGQVLSPVAAAVGALIAAHLTWTTAILLVAPRRSRMQAAVAALTPTAWRRLVTIATTGTLTVALAMPATAALSGAAVDSTDAGWVASPAQATTEAATETAQPASASSLPGHTQENPHATDPRQLVVAHGDTLWDLTAAQLDLLASDHEAIAAAWPELYDQNQDTIGHDPGLIVPGQQLVIPDGWSE